MASEQLFTYDEVVECIRKKQSFWQEKSAKQANVEDSKVLALFAAACDFIIQDVAEMGLKKLSDERKKRASKL